MRLHDAFDESRGKAGRQAALGLGQSPRSEHGSKEVEGCHTQRGGTLGEALPRGRELLVAQFAAPRGSLALKQG